jgi:response regulator of citrate/malate metabolism
MVSLLTLRKYYNQYVNNVLAIGKSRPENKPVAMRKFRESFKRFTNLKRAMKLKHGMNNNEIMALMVMPNHISPASPRTPNRHV